MNSSHHKPAESMAERLIQMVFSVNPSARLYGQCVIMRILKMTDKISDMEFLWPGSVAIEALQSALEEQDWEVAVMDRIYENKSQVLYTVIIAGQEYRLLITIGMHPWETASFRVLSLAIDVNGKKWPLYAWYLDYHLDRVMKDIEQRCLTHISVAGYRQKQKQHYEESSYLQRYSRLRMIRDAATFIHLQCNWGCSNDYKILQLILRHRMPTERECVICTSSLQTNHNLKLFCGHQFHIYCLEDWVTQLGAVSSQCPLCRHGIEL
jgi:hypothetical protein